jgi:hypothetical protein
MPVMSKVDYRRTARQSGKDMAREWIIFNIQKINFYFTLL